MLFVNLINENNFTNIYKSNVLEVGIGIGHKSINLSKLFDNYYAIEPIKDIYKICKKNCNDDIDCKIKLFNYDLEKFVSKSKIKFNLIILENSIHFIGLNKFFSLINNITCSDTYIIIKNPLARPYGWGNKELCADSEIFNEKKWTIFRKTLKSIYNELDNSQHLVKKIKNNFYKYYLLKL